MTSALAQSPGPLRLVADRLGGVTHAYGGVVGSRTYFPLWLGQLASSFGDTLHYIALVVLVFQLTGQGIAVAALVVRSCLCWCSTRSLGWSSTASAACR
jgi:hypothetical protein